MEAFPLQAAAQRYPDKIALRQGNFTRSYSQLMEEAGRLSNALQKNGLAPGQIVALGELSIRDMVLLLWACWLGQFVAFPLNVRFPSRSLIDILAEMQPAVVITHTNYAGNRCFSPSDLLNNLEDELVVNPPFQEEHPASILMTSGSSGKPKFVQHSYLNHICSARASGHNIPLTPDDKWVLNLPLYHIGGLSLLFRTASAGAELILPEDDQSLINTLKSTQATHISLVATQLHRLMGDIQGKNILTQMKAILVGGSAIPQDLIKEGLDLGIPLHITYGCTEMSSQIATTGAEDRSFALNSSGKPLPGTDLIISHEGEILVRGNTLAMGYLERSELVGFRDHDGWYHTGDVGYLNVHGALTVTGRMDNQFISGGENIQPEHIERQLMETPEVSDAVVIPKTDEEFGARPVAFLRFSGDPLDGSELRSRLLGKLPGYMIPVAFYELSEDMIGNQIKISRKKLKEFLESGNNALHSL